MAAAVAAAAAVGVAVDDESATGAGAGAVAAEAAAKEAVAEAAAEAETGEVAVAEAAVFPNGGSPQKDYEHIASDAVGAAAVPVVSAPEPEQRWLPAWEFTAVCLGGLVCWLLLLRLRRNRRTASRLQKLDAMMSRLPGGGSGGGAGSSSSARSSNNDGRV